MKIGIAGAGAMGSIFAYFFNKAGFNTVFFEKSRDILAALKDGINITADSDVQKISFESGDYPNILKGSDVIFVFVKSYNTEEAVETIASCYDKQTVIATLQNGLGNKEIISRYIPEDKIVYGSTSIGATRIDNNTIKLGGMGNIVIGGSNAEAVKTVENILSIAGLDVNITEDPDSVVWKKAIINAGINPIGALLGIPNGEIIKNQYAKEMQGHLVREAVGTAVSLGLDFNPEEMVRQTISVCEKTAVNLCSMLQDVTARRKTEIDSINGIIIKYAEQNSVPVSYNKVIYNLIKAKELFY